MARPCPAWSAVDRVWKLDLRTPWKLGRHVLHCEPPPVGFADALHESYALLARLEAERPHGPQLDLPGTAGRTVAAVLAAYLAERKYRKAGGRKWVTETAARVLEEIGDWPLAELIPPEGTKRLWAWRDRIRREGYERRYATKAVRVAVGPRAMLDRMQVLRSALEWSMEPPRLWLPCLPAFPDPRLDESEPMGKPRDAWVDEATFRAVRDAIYSSNMGAGMMQELCEQGLLGDSGTVADYIARRRLWLSFAMYTGMRHHDLDELTDQSASLAFGVFWRFGRKTSDEEAAPEDLPPPLRADLEWERRRLGRDYFAGERIAGGPWPRATRVIAAACRRVGVPAFDVMTLRRSFCYHKDIAGVEEADLVRLMGHKDSRMIRRVYLQVPSRSKRNAAGAAWPEMATTAPGTGIARVLPISAPRMHSPEGDKALRMHTFPAKSKPKQRTGG